MTSHKLVCKVRNSMCIFCWLTAFQCR